ncbi:TetR family transcriptional regulator [Opitutales bacterium]|uniref:TetR/AcrR family transcriptional regulator n=1 Tax=Candidatus Chordibacter forsetii TaxID=3381758 RepID=UPI002313139C|nr:TetR family transcriptional regulator [Opitutales bacterium]MDA9119304.1 TetR family transcriptional regulator [Opitutales bacterium]MDC0363176.1 TetR family transcriptional regulator [Opitutales bacterium]MDC3283694.1 TetR family transcriptional regulator [Opitutales bacterium]
MISSPPKPAKPKLATRRRLIDATARLFAEHGYNGLTMRSVAQEADANLAAANYHFGSKDALVLEMLSERIQPINKRRLALLEEAKRRNGKLAPSAHEIFHSLIFPIGEEIARSSKSRWSLAQLVARTFTEPVYFIERMHQKFFSQIAKLYHQELSLAFPNVPTKEIHWHLHLAVSSMLGALAQHRRLRDFTEGVCSEEEVGEMINRLIRFVTHGFVMGINSSSTE